MKRTSGRKELVNLAADFCEQQNVELDELTSQISEELERRLMERDEQWKQEKGAIIAHVYKDKYFLDDKQWKVAVELELVVPLDEKSPKGDTCYPDQDLTDDQRIEVAKNTYYTAWQAADLLGVGVGTFRKLKVPTTRPPWDMGYGTKFYRLADIEANRSRVKPRKKGPSKALREAWADLNERQQQYLEVIYRRERQAARYYETKAAMFSEKKKGGEWRWVLHHTDPIGGGPRGIDKELGRLKILDEGTGSTYTALESRGLVELKHELCLFREEGELWVKLTRSGRRLIKAFME